MGSICLGGLAPPRAGAGNGGVDAVAVVPSVATTPDNKPQEPKPKRPNAEEKTGTAVAPLDDQENPRVGDRSRGNCIMLFPRVFSITWGEDPRYWAWYPMKETRHSSTEIEVAELKMVCWLELHVSTPVSDLTPGVTYEVAFQVMMRADASGWELPVKLGLKLPDGTVQNSSEELKEKPREQWLDLKVGEVNAQQRREGDMEISLTGSEGTEWKSGLVIKCIKIFPKK